MYFGRAGYRQVTNMMRNEGIKINHKRVKRIWREDGLKRPKKQTKKRRLWLTDGSCIRLRAEHENHAGCLSEQFAKQTTSLRSYDIIVDKTLDGRKIRFLNIIDESTHECLTSIPRRSWRNNDVIETLSELMIIKGTPEYQGKKMAVRSWSNNSIYRNRPSLDEPYSSFMPLSPLKVKKCLRRCLLRSKRASEENKQK